MPTVNQLIDVIAAGDPRAAAELLPLVYDELRQLAAARMAAEPGGHILQPTALVHEAYLRLVGSADTARWANRGHFFAAAAEAMRRVLVESARAKKRDKRGGGRRRVDLDPAHWMNHPDPARVLALDEAYTRLAAEDVTAAGVVSLHVFVGMPIDEVADCLGISRSTAYEQWAYARAWLGAALRDPDPAPDR
jgi:RNA polymerase sigma factor (TIGR02999 family)